MGGLRKRGLWENEAPASQIERAGGGNSLPKVIHAALLPDGVDVSQPFSFTRYGKVTAGRPRSEPDWGKPTVRDRRGACGNVDQGGTRPPPRLSKERVLETLHLQLCAPQIYPDPPQKAATISSKGDRLMALPIRQGERDIHDRSR